MLFAVVCRRRFLSATIPSDVLLLNEIFIIILPRMAIQSRGDQTRITFPRIIFRSFHHHKPSRRGMKGKKLSISTARSSAMLHNVFNVHVNQFKYSEKEGEEHGKKRGEHRASKVIKPFTNNWLRFYVIHFPSFSLHCRLLNPFA
jgi:hypothetical protein